MSSGDNGSTFHYSDTKFRSAQTKLIEMKRQFFNEESEKGFVDESRTLRGGKRTPTLKKSRKD